MDGVYLLGSGFSRAISDDMLLTRDLTEAVDTAIIGKLGDPGLLGLTIDERYGGTEVDMLSYARVCEEGIVKLFENTCGSVDMSGLGGER